MIEHCISAFYKEQDEKAFRIYVTDALMTISENTSKRVNQGRYMQKRYAELIDRTPKDERTKEEIIGHFKAKLRQK